MKIERVLVWSALVSLVCTLACAPEVTEVPATQLTVRVTADTPLHRDLASLRLRTAAPSEGRWTQRLEHTYDATALRWPVDLVLVAKEESTADSTFEIIVEALDTRGSVLAQSRVLTSYVKRNARLLPLALAYCADAAGGLCEDNPGCFGPGCRTCLASGCAVTPVVEAAKLPSATPAEGLEAGSAVETEPQGATGSGSDAGAQADTGTGAMTNSGTGTGSRMDAGPSSGDGGGKPGNACDNACDPLATCSVVNGNASCNCPAPYTSSDGGKTCVRGATAMDGGGVLDAAAPGSDAATSMGTGKLPRVTSTEGDGPFTPVVVMSTAPGGWVVHPSELGMGGTKHPLFVFGPGAGTGPQQYKDHLNRYASYGFVVYAPRASNDGTELKAGLDWLIEQNTVSSSPLYQKLDTTKAAAGGHSLGGLSAFAFGSDPRLTTIVNISGCSMDGMGASKLRSSAMFLCGASDIAATNCDRDLQNSTVPIFFTTLEGIDHTGSARAGLPATVAWLLWHLAGQEDPWKKEFLQPGGKFQSGIYTSKIKNW